jgi:biotin carboxyl carrier protein
MSVPANSAAPQPDAQGAAPKPATPNIPKPPSGGKWITALVLVAAGGATWWMLRPRPESKPKTPIASIRTVRIASGAVETRLRVAGSTSAKNFANIVAPRMRGPDAGRALILIQLAKSGSIVKKGDVVAQIDAQSIKDHLDDVEATVVQSEAEIRKLKAEHEIQMENLRQNLRVAKANYDKTRLDAKASEIRTVIDQELLKLSAEETDAQYKQLLKDVETTKLKQKAELRLQEIAKERNERHRDRHKTDVQRFTIIAPMGGLVVMQTLTRGGDIAQVQLGDQVAPGQPFMKIVDTGSMQVDAMINQAESERIRLGQRATVEFDAFPGLRLPGKVVAVGALAVGGWRQNYYIRNVPVRVQIEGADTRVIPDLSASGDILLKTEDGKPIVPLSAVAQLNGRRVVYVKQQNSFDPREVVLGAANNTRAAVESGLKPGDEIALLASAVLDR